MINKFKFAVIFVIFFSFSACNNSGKGGDVRKSESNTSSTSGGNSSNPSTNQVPVNDSSSFLNNVSSTQLSQALGTANLGNTCFANSVHKIIWQYLGKSFQADHAPKSNTVQINFYKFMESLNIRDSLLKNDVKNLIQVFNNDPYFSNSLDQIFDNVRDELIARGGTGNINGSVLKVHQANANSYLEKLFDILDFNSINRNSLFTLGMLLNKKSSSFQENIDNRINDSTFLKQELVVSDFPNVPNKVIISMSRTFIHKPEGTIKSKNRLEFPDQISLDFYSQDETGSVKKNFKVKGFVIHSGNLYGGHYFVYLQDNGVWYKHNDSQVAVVSTQAELEQMKEHFELESVIYLLEAE